MRHPASVSDSSPIIAFEYLDNMALLRKLTHTLHIPSAVRQEVFGTGPLPGWIIERPIRQTFALQTLVPRLGAGESEAIILALELIPSCLLMDDLAARRAAQSFHIPVVGTVGLLILGKKKGLLGTLRPCLDALKEQDFRLSERLYHLALQQVGE